MCWPARWRWRATNGAAPSTVTVKRLELADELPALDLTLRHDTGFSCRERASSCAIGRPKAAASSASSTGCCRHGGKSCFMLRASDFPPNKKNQTAQAFRKFREAGGRSLLVPIPDWERMMTVREFHAQHRHDPGFADWFQRAKLLSDIPPLVQLLRLDLFGARRRARRPRRSPSLAPASRTGAPRRCSAGRRRLDRLGQRHGRGDPAAKEEELPLSVLLDEAGDGANSILAGRGAALQQEHHAQQGRAEAPCGGARRLRLRQDHAGAVHHRAAAAAGARRRC